MRTRQDMVDDFVHCLDNEVYYDISNSFLVITLPFLDYANDPIDIVAVIKGKDIILTDDGYLIANGRPLTEFELESISHILKEYGAELHGSEITMATTQENLTENVQRFIQGVLHVLFKFLY